MWQKVEMRIEAEAPPTKNAGRGHYKRQWRVKRALKALKEYYGNCCLMVLSLVCVCIWGLDEGETGQPRDVG